MKRRFATENSFYVIDDENHRYLRMPRSHRPDATVDNQDSWRLVDGEWHEMREWRIERDLTDECDRLRIYTPDAVFGIFTSPIVEELDA